MGKILATIGGLLALVGTFAFTWTNAVVSGWGIMNIATSFNTVMAIVDANEKMIQIVLLVVFILTVISGVMILLGAKVRALAVIFGLVALFTGGLFIIHYLVDVDLIHDMVAVIASFGLSDPIVVDVIPYLLPLGTSGVVMGSVILAVGGLIGLIGGFTKNSED